MKQGEHQEILQIFLRSFDAHFFIAFLPFGAVLSRNFPPYFFAGIRATSCATFRPNTSVGNADRSRLCGDCPAMASYAKFWGYNGVECEKWRGCEACEALLHHRKAFLKNFQKTLDIS